MAQTQTRTKRAGGTRSSTRTKPRTSTNAARSKSTAKRSNGSTLGRVAEKAKLPLVAGGAAIAGLAGGVLAGRASRPNGRSQAFAGAVGTAAKEVGKAGQKVGELTAAY